MEKKRNHGRLASRKENINRTTQDIENIRTKFIKSGYPRNFINSAIQSLQYKISQEKPLIPQFLFKERRQITVKLPFGERNQKASSGFI